MIKRSNLLFFILIIILVLGHSYALFMKQKIWPFTPYAMFSHDNTGELFKSFKIVVKDRQGYTKTLNLQTEFKPFWRRALYESWVAHKKSGNLSQQEFLMALLKWKNAEHNETQKTNIPLYVEMRWYSLHFLWSDLKNLSEEGALYSGRIAPYRSKKIAKASLLEHEQ